MRLRTVSLLCAFLILTLSSSAVHALSVEHRADAARLLGTPQNSAATGVWYTSLTNTHIYPVVLFSPTLDKSAQYKFWKRNSGTDVQVTLYLLSTGAGTNAISKWKLRGGCRTVGDSYDDWVFGSYTSVFDIPGTTTNDELVSNASPVTVTLGGTPAAGDTCILEIWRTGSDDLDTWEANGELVEIKLVEP